MHDRVAPYIWYYKLKFSRIISMLFGGDHRLLKLCKLLFAGDRSSYHMGTYKSERIWLYLINVYANWGDHEQHQILMQIKTYFIQNFILLQECNNEYKIIFLYSWHLIIEENYLSLSKWTHVIFAFLICHISTIF